MPSPPPRSLPLLQTSWNRKGKCFENDVALGNVKVCAVSASFLIRPNGLVGESEGGVYACGVENGPGVEIKEDDVAVDGDDAEENDGLNGR